MEGDLLILHIFSFKNNLFTIFFKKKYICEETGNSDLQKSTCVNLKLPLFTSSYGTNIRVGEIRKRKIV